MFGLAFVVAISCLFAWPSATASAATDKPRVKALASGIAHTLALLEDGTVMAWGKNASGEVGDGTKGEIRQNPTPVTGLTDVVAVAGGNALSYALRKDGTVWAWGANNDGQLGNGTQTKLAADYLTVLEDHDSAVPVQVKGLDHVTAIASGWSTGYALKDDGTIWAWGSNSLGALGIGKYVPEITEPLQIPGLSNVVSISSGWNHAHAILRDGTAWSWGYNDEGNAGDGTRNVTVIENNVQRVVEENFKYSPVQIAGGHRFVSIAPMHNGGNYALEAEGSLWYWGVVNHAAGIYHTTPVQVPGMSGIKAIYGVANGVYVLKADGSLWTTDKTYDDFTAMKLPKIVSVSAGGWFHALAIAEDGSVWAWGENSDGRLGDGTVTYRTKAHPVQLTAFYAPEPKLEPKPEPKPETKPKPEIKPGVYVNGKLSAAKLITTAGYPALGIQDAAKLVGGKASENKKKKTFQIVKGKTTVIWTAGSLTVRVNGKAAKLKEKPYAANGTLAVPASALEPFGAKLKWDAKAGRLDIALK